VQRTDCSLIHFTSRGLFISSPFLLHVLASKWMTFSVKNYESGIRISCMMCLTVGRNSLIATWTECKDEAPTERRLTLQALSLLVCCRPVVATSLSLICSLLLLRVAMLLELGRTRFRRNYPVRMRWPRGSKYVVYIWETRMQSDRT